MPSAAYQRHPNRCPLSMIRRKCRKLAESLAEHPITFEPRPLIDKRSKVLALGSCFALRVKEWLLANGYAVLNEGDLARTISAVAASSIRESTTTRFASATNSNASPANSSRPTTTSGNRIRIRLRVYQDPYRRMLAAEDARLLWQRIREVDEHMRQHILAADCVIITLGLTEVFFQQHNGHAICAAPGYCGGGGIGCEFRATEYPENFANIERVVEILREVNPKAQVILTVSPVPLAATWSGVDHAIANTESKCTLRAVAGAIVRQFDHVHYFHSYELVMHAARNDVFLKTAGT